MNHIGLSYPPSKPAKALMSMDYHRAMKLLDTMTDRDWELEAACSYCRKMAERQDLYELNQAEANLRRVLERIERVC